MGFEISDVNHPDAVEHVDFVLPIQDIVEITAGLPPYRLGRRVPPICTMMQVAQPNA